MLKRKRKHPDPPPKKIPPQRNLSKMMQFIFFRFTECENHKVSGRLKSDYVVQFCHKVIKYIEFGRIVYNKSAKNCINIVDLADSFECNSYSMTVTRESKLEETLSPAAVSFPTWSQKRS